MIPQFGRDYYKMAVTQHNCYYCYALWQINYRSCPLSQSHSTMNELIYNIQDQQIEKATIGGVFNLVSDAIICTWNAKRNDKKKKHIDDIIRVLKEKVGDWDTEDWKSSFGTFILV